METEYLNIENASEFLLVSKRTMYKYAETRTLPFIQHGIKGKIYFRKSDLIAWLESGLISKK